MKLLSVFAVLFAFSSASVLPRGYHDWEKCLSQAEAEYLVGEYITVLSHTDIQAANATAQAAFDDNYVEISDSILSLEGQPLGTNTFTGKTSYIINVLNAPPLPGVNTLEILVAGCTKVLWYWKITGLGSGQYEVKGFNLFTFTPEKKFATAAIEFNSIAWGLDTGYQVIFPTGPAPPK